LGADVAADGVIVGVEAVRAPLSDGTTSSKIWPIDGPVADDSGDAVPDRGERRFFDFVWVASR